jgi:hypothetical protein
VHICSPLMPDAQSAEAVRVALRFGRCHAQQHPDTCRLSLHFERVLTGAVLNVEPNQPLI